MSLKSGDEEMKVFLTILTWVPAECGPLQHSGILADVPDVKVYKDWEGCESSHPEPSQHEDVCQHDELQKHQRKTHHNFVLENCVRPVDSPQPLNIYLFIHGEAGFI